MLVLAEQHLQVITMINRRDFVKYSMGLAISLCIPNIFKKSKNVFLGKGKLFLVNKVTGEEVLIGDCNNFKIVIPNYILSKHNDINDSNTLPFTFKKRWKYD